MAGIANQKNIALAVFVGNDTVRYPLVNAEYFKRQVYAGRAANQVGRCVFGDLHVRRQCGWHKEPAVTGIHRPQDAGNI